MIDYDLKQMKHYVEKVERRGHFKAHFLPAIIGGLFIGLMIGALDYFGDRALEPDFSPYLFTKITLLQFIVSTVFIFCMNLWFFKSAKKTIAREDALKGS